jgi:hypothetical protein
MFVSGGRRSGIRPSPVRYHAFDDRTRISDDSGVVKEKRPKSNSECKCGREVTLPNKKNVSIAKMQGETETDSSQ